MPLITVSADSLELELDIARRAAEALGYDLLGRELLADVAQTNGLTEDELVKALDSPPGFLGLRARRRRNLLTHIQAACLDRLLADNVVCHGLAAHLYVMGVSHAIRVRVVGVPCDPDEDEVRSDENGRQPDQRIQARRCWSLEVFQVDETDPNNYDLVLNLTQQGPDDMVEKICQAARDRRFMAMTYSRKCLLDKALSSRVREALMSKFPDVRVEANDGAVKAEVQSLGRDQRKKQEAVREMVSQIPGVSFVEVHVVRDLFGLGRR